MAKRFVLVGVIALVIALALAPAALAVANGYGGNVTTEPGTGPTGTGVVTTGEAGPGETLTFVFCSQAIPVGTVQADVETGKFTLNWTIPATADTGQCTLRGTGDQGTVITQAFTVTTTQNLAFTGAQIAFWALAGLGLMALGAGLIIRRRTVTA